MNILEKKSRINYEDIIKQLILNIGIGRNQIELLGSAGLSSMLYPTDFDLYTKIKKKPKLQTLFNTINEILDYLETIPKLKIVETKYEYNENEKKKFYENNRISYNEFSNIYNKLNLIKIDMIYELNFDLKEISIIYDFSNIEKDYEKELRKDIVELEKKGEYYKILKRIFSIEKIRGSKGNEKLMLELLKIFNSNIGKLYSELKTKELQGINIEKQMNEINNYSKNLILNLKKISK